MPYGSIVLASTASGFIPNAIKFVTGSIFSHSFITTPDILSTPMCIEAAESGVDFTRFDKSYQNDPNQSYEVWNVLVDQETKDKAIVSVLNELQIPYGLLQYPWFMWRRVCVFFGKDIKSQDNWNKDGMICSQLCVFYLKACGLEKIFKDYGEGSIAPQDLQDIMKANPDLFKKIDSVRL